MRNISRSSFSFFIFTTLVTVLSSATLSCASPWQPPAPPPAQFVPPPPPLWPPDPRLAQGSAPVVPAPVQELVDGKQPEVPTLPAETTGAPSAAPTASGTDDSASAITLEIETPYKLGERPVPEEQEAYRADLLERRHWNNGSMGKLTAEPADMEGHPDPRVTIDIGEKDVRGRHKAKVLQRVARKYHWINVVRCYRLGAYKDPHLRGWTKGHFWVTRSGRVAKPRLSGTKLSDKAVAQCMIDKLSKLKFPRARRARGKLVTRVKIQIRVGPGDEPMPPPAALIVPGEGELSIEAMRAGVAAGLPAMKRCYRAAFDYAPGLWGRIVIRFHLSKHGKLNGAFEGGSRFPDARVRQCILHEARKLSFERPKGGELRFVVPIRLWSPRADLSRQPTKRRHKRQRREP